MGHAYRCGSCHAVFTPSRLRCTTCGTAGVETDRDSCWDCESELTPTDYQQCRVCGSEDVERLPAGEPS